MFRLFAANTNFQPKRNGTTATYTFCSEGSLAPISETKVGCKVSAKYKGEIINGKVTEAVIASGKKRWKVRFNDGYETICSESKLKKWLTPPKRVYKQLDYILVSHRWKSSIIDCKTRWGPSIHRSRWGIREDHALVCDNFKWRIRDIALPERRDFSTLALPETTNANGQSTCAAKRFNVEFKKQLLLQQEGNDKSNNLILYYKDGEPFEVPRGYTALDDFYDSEDEDFNPFDKSKELNISGAPSSEVAKFMMKMEGSVSNPEQPIEAHP